MDRNYSSTMCTSVHAVNAEIFYDQLDYPFILLGQVLETLIVVKDDYMWLHSITKTPKELSSQENFERRIISCNQIDRKVIQIWNR